MECRDAAIMRKLVKHSWIDISEAAKVENHDNNPILNISYVSL